MKVDKMAQGIANYINKSKGAQKVLRNISKNPAMAGATSSFIISTTIRPATILAITPDKDDAKYGACSSISSALTEVVGSFALFKPMNKYIEESSRQLYKKEGSLFCGDAMLLRKYKSVTNRIAKLPLTMIIALTRFSLLAPMAALLANIGIVKGGKKEEKGLDKQA